MDQFANFSTYFRPRTFSEVVGQTSVKQALIKIALSPGIVCRSIFLKGPFGCGKTTLCRIFAAAMNDPDFARNKDVTPANCADVYAPNSQLYLEFDSSVAGNIDAIRALSDRLSFVPQGRRVVVFDEVHACSRQALNALLKIVEEGVPNTIFVFASTEDILPTIKSRSICLELTTVPHAEMSQRLFDVASSLNLPLSQVQADQICLKSFGHMRDALSILQLFSIVGDTALSTSYSTLSDFFLASARKDRSKAESLLSSLLYYPSVDIKNSLYAFIKSCYIADSSSPLYPFLKTGLVSKIFSYFFSPHVQSALKDEFGIELAFRDFLDKIAK